MGKRHEATSVGALDRYPGDTGCHRAYPASRYGHLALADAGSGHWFSIDDDWSHDTSYTTWRGFPYRGKYSFVAVGRGRGCWSLHGCTSVEPGWGQAPPWLRLPCPGPHLTLNERQHLVAFLIHQRGGFRFEIHAK